MTKQQKEEILAFLNAFRVNGKKVTLETAKGAYILEERSRLEVFFSKEQVNEVFGEPGHLEKAGAMLEQIRIWHFEGENSFEEELEREKEFLIDIVYQISNACGRLDSSHILWEKYATLYNEIPIDMMQYSTKPLDSWPKGKVCYVSAHDLEIAKNWLKIANVDAEPAKREYILYIFRLVHISLEEIFEEVKDKLVK